MPSITSTGVGSGLDVNTIVSSLMTVEKRQLNLMQAQASTLQTKVSAYGTLQSQLAALGDLAGRLATPASWSPMRVDSGDTAAVTASAAGAASAGSHAIEVERLARSQVLASGSFASAATAVGSGTLRIELGTTDAGAFTPRAGSTPVTVTVGAGQDTLAGVRDAINAAKSGVTASIVTGSGGAQLVLRGPDGAAGSMRIGVTDADGNATDTAGLSALAWDPALPAGAGGNLAQTQAAQDARFSVNGVWVTSASNSPADVLEGVTLTLKKPTAAPVALTVAVETMAVRKNVNDFVNAYNALNTLLRNQTQADPSGKSRGPLQADSAAVGVLASLRTLVQGALAAGDGPASLNAAGIELQRDGSLTVSEARLSPLLAQPARLAALFGQAGTPGDAASRGFGLRFKEWARGLTGEEGVITARTAGLKRSQTDSQKRQEAENERLARTESRLRAQYQRLDQQMSELDARMSRMRNSLGLG